MRVFSTNLICCSSFRLPCYPKALGLYLPCGTAPAADALGTRAPWSAMEVPLATRLLWRQEMGRQWHLFPHLVILVVFLCHCLCLSHAGTHLDRETATVAFCSQYSTKALWMALVKVIKKWLGYGNLFSGLQTKAALSGVPGLGRSQATGADVSFHHSKPL